MIVSNDTLLFLLSLSWTSRLILGFKSCRTDLTLAASFTVFRTLHTLDYSYPSGLLCVFAISVFVCVLLVAYSFYAVPEIHLEKRPSQRATSFKPLIFPSRTSHVRLFPKKHGFSYSYLLVGVPLERKAAPDPTDSSDDKTSPEDANVHALMPWFKVDASDYLDRGNSHLGFQCKLDMYLKDQVRP